MTLTETIEILLDLQTTLPQRPPEDRRKAVNIAIEAVKRIQLQRKRICPPYDRWLPGETEK